MLDLKSPAGRADFEALVRTADCGRQSNLRGDLPAKMQVDIIRRWKAHQGRHRGVHLSAYGRGHEREGVAGL